MRRLTWFEWAVLHFAAAALLLAAFVATGNNDFSKLATIALLVGISCGVIDLGFGS